MSFAFIFVFSAGSIIGLVLTKTTLRRREAFSAALLIWALFAVLIVEVLNFVHSLNRTMVSFLWGCVFLAMMFLWFVVKVDHKKSFSFPKMKFSRIEWAWFILVCVFLAVSFITAIVSSPNNWDSMAYHLPRIMHWIQNQSVNHYPTHILRQLYQPPGAEYLILQFQILAGNDHWDNLVQWFALLGSALLGSLIAQLFKANVRGQVLSAFLIVTLPIGILEAVSTQNDYIAGFWLLGFVYFLLRDLMEYPSVLGKSLAGGFLAMALLTKGTMYIFVIPWILIYIISHLRSTKRGWIFGILLWSLIVVLVNAGFWVRNWDLWGSALAHGQEDYVCHNTILGCVMSNTLGNFLLNFVTGIQSWNGFLKSIVLGWQKIWVGTNTQGITWGDLEFPNWSTNEDIAGNPCHAVLLVTAFLVILFSRKRLGSGYLIGYISAVFVGYELFCAVFKWQMFHSRLLLPLFLLGMPAAGLVLAKMSEIASFKRWSVFLTLIIMLASIPYLLCNERHPILAKKNIFNTNRIEQYFLYRKFMFLPYALSAGIIPQGYNSQVGLVLGQDDWEYPLWVLLKNRKQNIKIVHTGVNNPSRSLPHHDPEPAQYVIYESETPQEIMNWDQHLYQKRKQIAFMSIYSIEK